MAEMCVCRFYSDFCSILLCDFLPNHILLLLISIFFIWIYILKFVAHLHIQQHAHSRTDTYMPTKLTKNVWNPKEFVFVHKMKSPSMESVENRPPISKLFWNKCETCIQHKFVHFCNSIWTYTRRHGRRNELLKCYFSRLHSMNFGERQHNYVLGQNISLCTLSRKTFFFFSLAVKLCLCYVWLILMTSMLNLNVHIADIRYTLDCLTKYINGHNYNIQISNMRRQ